MSQFVFSPAADQDVLSILSWTEEQFGEQARTRYEALLVQAILDVAEIPERVGVNQRPEIAQIARTYHLLHSRNRVAKKIGRVHKPRHFLLFRILQDGTVEIGRVLHDSVDLVRHLPEQYRADTESSA